MNRINNLLTIAALALGIAALTAPAANAQTFYSSLSDFNAAATTGTLYTFEGIAPANNFVEDPDVLVNSAPGRITFAVTGGADLRVLAVDSAFNGGNFAVVDGTDSVLAGRSVDGGSATTRINLDAAYTAFAIEIGQQFNGRNSYTIGLYNGNAQVGTNFVIIGADPFFFGATSDTAFNNVRVLTVLGIGRFTTFDNARTGSVGVAVVPEAGTLALLLPALGVLGVVVRRKK